MYRFYIMHLLYRRNFFYNNLLYRTNFFYNNPNTEIWDEYVRIEWLLKHNKINEYINEIDKLQEKKGSKVALLEIINDVGDTTKKIEVLDRTELEKLTDKINELVDDTYFTKIYDWFDPYNILIGLDIKTMPEDINILRKIHFFRNIINEVSGAPATLNEMLKLAKKNKWKLCPIEESLYHVYDTEFSQDSKYNLKFVSANDKFEAVYNKEGKLLTKENDSKNMGSYNYGASILGHLILDMVPWFLFGNVEGQDIPSNFIKDEKINWSKMKEPGPLWNREDIELQVKCNKVVGSDRAIFYVADFWSFWAGVRVVIDKGGNVKTYVKNIELKEKAAWKNLTFTSIVNKIVRAQNRLYIHVSVKVDGIANNYSAGEFGPPTQEFSEKFTPDVRFFVLGDIEDIPKDMEFKFQETIITYQGMSFDELPVYPPTIS